MNAPHSADSNSLLARIMERFFPKSADFFQLLYDQSIQVEHTVGLLVQFMEEGDPEIGNDIKEDEHAADRVKVLNIHTLNEAFSTPIDREDIYRAISTLDEIVNACKDTVNEMYALQLKPNAHTLEMARLLHDGIKALVSGYGKLRDNPSSAATDANLARKAERKVEKLYRRALAELFEGDDFRHMFKRREIYRNLTGAAERMAACANTLHDIVVKMI